MAILLNSAFAYQLYTGYQIERLLTDKVILVYTSCNLLGLFLSFRA